MDAMDDADLVRYEFRPEPPIPWLTLVDSIPLSEAFGPLNRDKVEIITLDASNAGPTATLAFRTHVSDSSAPNGLARQTGFIYAGPELPYGALPAALRKIKKDFGVRFYLVNVQPAPMGLVSSAIRSKGMECK